MPTVHALLVAINAYPHPVPPLNGCVDDMRSIKAHLEAHFNHAELSLRAEVLENEQATRENIIKGFDLFEEAEDGDSCLFFFAGHGSRCAAPEAFCHIEPDRMNESLVCYDSRDPEGRDLMDKELSYLIWKATRDKDVHFLAVTDCCHSGSNTRFEQVKVRRAEKVTAPNPLEAYLGFKQYKKAGDGQYSPPRGRHIHLAAAQATQTAKEVYVKGKPRGVFSYCLVEALKGAQNQISYAELLSRVNIRLRNAVRDQSSQLETTRAEDKNLLFLSRALAGEGPNYVVGYEKKLGWTLNAGALHGIHPGDEHSKTILELVENGREIEVVKVLADRSQVHGMDEFDKKNSFKAIMKSRAVPKLSVSFAADTDAAGVNLLRQLLLEKKSDFYRLVETSEEAGYVIHMENDTLFLTSPHNDWPLFRRVQGNDHSSAVDFLNKLEKVFNWVQALELTNPDTTIRDNEIQIELYQVTEPGNQEDDAPTQLLDWRASGEFRHRMQGGSWHYPAFQLKIKNTGLRTLWVSLLFLGKDFGITNQLLPSEALKPGAEAWALDVYEGHPYRTVSLRVEDEFYDWGITTIDEYLKLFICTEPFYTDDFFQEGLEMERAETPYRTFGRRKSPQKQDWATKDIHLKIHRPLEPAPLQAGQPLALFNIEATGPEGFEARVFLNTLEKAIQHFDSAPDWDLPGSKSLFPLELGPLESRPGLSVLEMIDLNSPERISGEFPLEIRFNFSGKIEEIIPAGCDPQTGSCFDIPFERKGSSLFIRHLPKPSPSGYPELGDSVKVFFFTPAF
jgi:hypothetical protein